MKSFPLLLAVLGSAVGYATVADAARKPNVIVILSDDQGWGDLSVHGNTDLSTPNIDSLARDGALFDRFYVCPVCSPTRAEFLTGRYHPRGGVFSTSTGGERLDLDESTIAETFKAAGYATAAFGKWHNGLQHPYHPNSRGFDEFYGFCSGHWGHYFSPELEHNGRIVRGNGYVADDFTERAMSWIASQGDKPFFCYLPYNTPHSPWQVPDTFYRKFDGKVPELRDPDPKREELDKTRAALAMCENIDWNVGRLLKKLDELKLTDDTIVIYFSDNGPNSWRWNGGMRGRKGSTDEGGVRVPFLLRWPGQVRAGLRVPQIAAAIDLLPTLADLAGIPVKSTSPLDGVSLKPLLAGEGDGWKDRVVFSHWNGRVSARNQRFRLDQAGKLYDMQSDPGQERDVSRDHPEVSRSLRESVEVWKQEVLSELTREDRPFPVGHRDADRTYLPARDGVPHGQVRRSNSAPNCSYFTGWKSADDSITWDVEVLTPGRYEAVVHYTCAEKDVGSEVELSFRGGSVRARVTVANDPPLVGLAEDRADRGPESFVKDFRPMSLGVIELTGGRGDLRLKALSVAGGEVMEVRYVVLTRAGD